LHPELSVTPKGVKPANEQIMTDICNFDHRANPIVAPDFGVNGVPTKDLSSFTY